MNRDKLLDRLDQKYKEIVEIIKNNKGTISENDINYLMGSLANYANNGQKFELSFEYKCIISTDELWPNGNCPDNPKKSDVEELIEKDGGPLEFLYKHNLWNRYVYLRIIEKLTDISQYK
jgi:hypothetical protein